jgi:inner membrane transporter RhtA
VAIEFVGPLAVAVLASRRRLDFMWVALAVIGLSLLLPIAPGGTPLDPAGVLYALLAGVGWALYIVFGQKAGRVQGASASMWGLVIAAIVTVPVGIAHAGVELLDPAVLWSGLGIAIFSSALPYTLEMVALRRLSAKTFGTLMSFEPAIAAIAGVVILGERLAVTQWLAIGAIITASVGAVSGEPQRADHERADFAP